MRRRLAVAILVTVWALLLVGGLALYLGVRAILVADLDALLFARASALPELHHSSAFDPLRIPIYDWHDRYEIRSERSRSSTSRPMGSIGSTPRVIWARFTRDAQNQRWRTVAIAASASGVLPGEGVVVEYSGRTERVDAILRKVALAMVGFGLFGGIVTAGVAMWVSGMVLGPLRTTAQWIGSIDERNLDERVSLERLPPELLPVSDRLNTMLSKLERAFEAQRRLLAAASNELRGSVTALSASLSEANQQAHDTDALRSAMCQCVAQTDVLRALIDRLSEYVAEARRTPEKPQAVDVVAAINQCADTAAAIAGLRGIEVVRSGPKELRCMAPLGQLQSIVTNMLTNAVEQGQSGGTIELAFFHDGRQLHVRVCDNGVGVPAAHGSPLFDPFHGSDAPKGQASGRLGLGPLIVHAHVKALGGGARIDSQGGRGTAIEIEFPSELLVSEGLLDPPTRLSA